MGGQGRLGGLTGKAQPGAGRCPWVHVGQLWQRKGGIAIDKLQVQGINVKRILM